jgi:hypothetical protein
MASRESEKQLFNLVVVAVILDPDVTALTADHDLSVSNLFNVNGRFGFVLL